MGRRSQKPRGRLYERENCYTSGAGSGKAWERESRLLNSQPLQMLRARTTSVGDDCELCRMERLKHEDQEALAACTGIPSVTFRKLDSTIIAWRRGVRFSPFGSPNRDKCDHQRDNGNARDYMDGYDTVKPPSMSVIFIEWYTHKQSGRIYEVVVSWSPTIRSHDQRQADRSSNACL